MERHRRTWIAIAAGLGSGALLAAAAPGGLSGWIAWVALAPAAAVALAWRGTSAGRLAVPLAYGIYLELLLIPALPFGIASGQWGEAPPVMIGDSPVVFVALIAVPAFAWLLYAIRFGEPWGTDRVVRRLSPIAAVAIPASAFAALDFVRISLDPGAAWGPLFLSQHGGDSAALATLGGPWLVSFAIAASGYAIALLGLAAGALSGGHSSKRDLGLRAVATGIATAATGTDRSPPRSTARAAAVAARIKAAVAIPVATARKPRSRFERPPERAPAARPSNAIA
jgi:apolipoprotein N-acyltransferase